MKKVDELNLEELLELVERPARRDGSPNPTPELARRLKSSSAGLKRLAGKYSPGSWNVSSIELSKELRDILHEIGALESNDGDTEEHGLKRCIGHPAGESCFCFGEKRDPCNGGG